MKKILILSLGLFLIQSAASAAIMTTTSGTTYVADGVYAPLCMQGNTLCAVGKYIMSSSSSKPLYVNGNIVCTNDQRICTNGYYVLHSNATRYY